MKKYLTTLLLIWSALFCYAQTQTFVENIRTYCIVDSSADYLFKKPKQYNKPLKFADCPKTIHGTRENLCRLMMLPWKTTFIRPEKILSGLWAMISQQPDGQGGTLSVQENNYLPTAYNRRETYIITRWDTAAKRWHISSMYWDDVTSIQSGSKLLARR